MQYKSDTEALQDFVTKYNQLTKEIAKVIVGQEDTVKNVLISVFSRGLPAVSSARPRAANIPIGTAAFACLDRCIILMVFLLVIACLTGVLGAKFQAVRPAIVHGNGVDSDGWFGGWCWWCIFFVC